MTRTIRWYGWKPDLPDRLDADYEFKPKAIRLPRASRLPADKMPPVWNQGTLGSCTAWSTNAALVYLRAVKGEPYFSPSALFTYYNTRRLEGTLKYDAGAEIRSTIKATVNLGCAPSRLWPYKIGRFTELPPARAYEAALSDILQSYELVPIRVSAIKNALATGLPVVFGFSVFESFDNISRSGLMPMPKSTESIVGGHAVWAWGYDDDKPILTETGGFLNRNSWGKGWGASGNFWMPYKIIENGHCDDFWALRAIT